MLISRGLFFKQEKVVPASWIGDISEESVKLSVDAKVLENLPAYED